MYSVNLKDMTKFKFIEKELVAALDDARTQGSHHIIEGLIDGMVNEINEGNIIVFVDFNQGSKEFKSETELRSKFQALGFDC